MGSSLKEERTLFTEFVFSNRNLGILFPDLKSGLHYFHSLKIETKRFRTADCSWGGQAECNTTYFPNSRPGTFNGSGSFFCIVAPERLERFPFRCIVICAFCLSRPGVSAFFVRPPRRPHFCNLFQRSKHGHNRIDPASNPGRRREKRKSAQLCSFRRRVPHYRCLLAQRSDPQDQLHRMAQPSAADLGVP